MTDVVYERVQASVKFYSRDKGYGFCKREGKMDVYISQRALERSGVSQIKENDMLEFDLVPVLNKGGRAINIKVVK